ncbi:cysteine peptidase family C39 domain-containing protein [Alicyclobacillus tolerans]|uniref:Peptidase C39 family protein n=1 Tax=Alicyclobacillus tolerans TaxID=90970 RepID=A0A1M6VVT4_9BACL|nr:cysteine peptidase family C39 domain-containing protein [Alicyclobacillus montanus]SHK85662.1 Peptidase C39 family protein [Alicyclobacillus montanus]
MSNKYPFYFQSAVHDCIPACVMALADYYHVQVNLKDIRKILVTNPQHGTAIENLRNLGDILHVQLGRLVDLSELPQYIPFISYLKQAHAVVVWEYDLVKGKILIGDPAVGIVQIPIQDFLTQWDGLTAVLRNLPENEIGLTPQY